MRRRSVLAASVALFAGCGTFSGDESGTTDSPSGETATEDSPTPEPMKNSPTPDSGNTPDKQGGQNDADESIWRDIDEVALPDTRTVVDFDTTPLFATVAGTVQTTDGITVEVDMSSGATAESPATFTAAITNRLSYEQTIRPYRLVVMGDPPLGKSSEGEYVYFVPTEDHPFVETVPEYERDEEGCWRVASVADDWFPDTLTLPPERGFTADYYVLGPPERDSPPIKANRYAIPPGASSGFELVAWPTDEPGPQGKSRFADADPPTLVGAERMAWFHDAGPETTRYVRPSTESVDLPGTIEFEFHNRREEPVVGNPLYWRVHKLVDGEWFPIAPWLWPQPATELGPGERNRSTLALFHGEAVDIDTRTLGYVGGGTYAYELNINAFEPPTFAAMFEVDAPSLTLDIEEEATVTGDGATTEVTLPNHSDRREPATAVITPANGTPNRRLLPEQLPRRRFRVLRNSLPLLIGEDSRNEVQVRTNQVTVHEVRDYFDGEAVFAYQDRTYRVTTVSS